MLEAFPHRLVLQVARVDALQHDGKLKVAERNVVADPGDVPSGPARVPGGELGPGQEARARGAVGPQAGTRGSLVWVEPALLAPVGPVDQGQSQVGERIAQ